MIYSKDFLRLSLIKNQATIKSSNTIPYQSSCSITLIKPPCLTLNQYSTKVENKLIYYIYIMNNLKCDITNIQLKDILPKGVKFISTSTEQGQYQYCKDKIFYNIDIIKPHSFCNITITLSPITLGKKINSVEVVNKNFKCIINNPFKVYSLINLM